MTYAAVLATFIGPPLAVLALVEARARRRGHPPGHALDGRNALAVLAALVVVAVVYTTPWDNYLVATGVWWYDPALVAGITLGWVPLEEYVFFVLQPLLTGLWLLALSRRMPEAPPDPPADAARMRRRAALGAGALWLASAVLLASGWKPGTYLGLELTWGLLPVVGQLALGADMLWRRRRLVALGVAVPTLYLWILDATALRAATWTIDPAQSVGIVFFGVLPVEEAVFFLMTNVLVAFGLVLLTAREGVRAEARA